MNQHGMGLRRWRLARATIENVGGTRTHGDYVVKFYGKARLLKVVAVHGYPRQRLNVWYLLKMALENGFVRTT